MQLNYRFQPATRGFFPYYLKETVAMFYKNQATVSIGTSRSILSLFNTDIEKHKQQNMSPDDQNCQKIKTEAQNQINQTETKQAQVPPYLQRKN